MEGAPWWGFRDRVEIIRHRRTRSTASAPGRAPDCETAHRRLGRASILVAYLGHAQLLLGLLRVRRARVEPRAVVASSDRRADFVRGAAGAGVEVARLLGGDGGAGRGWGRGVAAIGGKGGEALVRLQGLGWLCILLDLPPSTGPCRRPRCPRRCRRRTASRTIARCWTVRWMVGERGAGRGAAEGRAGRERVTRVRTHGGRRGGARRRARRTGASAAGPV